MIVLDLIGIATVIAILISIYRSKVTLFVWLFEYSGTFGYVLKFFLLVVLVTLAIIRVDWNIFMYKIF